MIRTVHGAGHDEMMKRAAVAQALDEAAKAELLFCYIMGRTVDGKRWVTVSEGEGVSPK